MGVTKFPNGVGTSDTNYLGSDGSLTLGGSTITAAEIAALGGTGLDATELGILDGATVTTAELNILDGVTSTTAELNILDGVTATAAEINVLDASANTETITVAGAINPATRVTYLDATSGAYAVTLAAPDASMLGQVKVIEMTVAGNAITLALTEAQGGTAAASASFDAANETLVLVAGSLKWNVVGESGVTLT